MKNGINPINDTLPTIYEYKLFQLINVRNFDNVCNELSMLYSELYSKKSNKKGKNNWVDYNGKKLILKFKKYENKYKYFYNNDIRFVQKVNINKKDSKILIIGDFHSSFHSLYQILKINRNFFIDKDSLKLKNNRYIVFLGDIIDRGPYGIELIYIIFILKIINFDNIFIIAGNHEYQETYDRYGFYDEIKYQFGSTIKGFNMNESIKNREPLSFERIFWYLPQCIYLNFQGNIYHLSHGSVVHDLDKELTKFFYNKNKKFMYIGDKGINYKWGDFDYEVVDSSGYEYNKSRAGNDTKSPIKKYGIKYVKEYMNNFNITMCITGHQDKTPIAFLLDYKETDKDTDKDKLFSKCEEEEKFCPFLVFPGLRSFRCLIG